MGCERGDGQAECVRPCGQDEGVRQRYCQRRIFATFSFLVRFEIFNEIKGERVSE